MASPCNSTLACSAYWLIDRAGLIVVGLVTGSLLAALAVCASADTAHRDYPGLALDTTALPENHTILGRVVDSFNQLPVSGAHVTFAWTINATTDLDGNFEIRNIDRSTYPPGNYSLTVSKWGYRPASTTTAIPPQACPWIPMSSNTVLLLHGIRTTYASWFEEWEPGHSFYSVLTENSYNVIVPAFENSCGEIRENASVLLLRLRMLHSIGIQSYSIVGHSAGGLIARYYLNSFPELGDLGQHVQNLITLGTPHHGSPLAITALGTVDNRAVRDIFCDDYSPIIEELVPGNATLNLLNYGITEVQGEDAPCDSHEPEIRIGIDPARVYCLVGSSPESILTLRLWYHLFARYGCPNNDGVVPFESAYLTGVRDQNQWWDGELTDAEGKPCATEHFHGPHAFKINPCIASAVKAILDGTPPTHTGIKSTPKSNVVRQQFLPTVSRSFAPGESLVDSSLVIGLSQAMFMCSWGADSLDYYLETPTGQTISGPNSVGNPAVTWLADGRGAMYVIDFPEPGVWKHHVVCPVTAAPDTLQFTISFDSQLELNATVTSEVSPTGAFSCVALFKRGGLALPAARVVAEVTTPNGGLATLRLADDGTGGDPVPQDGEYWGTLPAAGRSGVFSFLFRAVEDSTQVLSEARETQQVGMARRYSNIEVPTAEFVIGSQAPNYGALVDLAATYRNIGSSPADSVLLMIENMRYGSSLADTVVSLAPGESFTLQTSWLAAATDTTNFRAVAVVLKGNIDSDPTDNVALSWARVSYPDVVVGVPGDPGIPPTDPSEDAPKVQVEIAPNPSNFGAVISFVLADPGPVKLSIFDLAGRKVRSLIDGNLERGEQRVRWDGLDKRGAPVSSGVYLCRLERAGKMQITKMAVVK